MNTFFKESKKLNKIVDQIANTYCEVDESCYDLVSEVDADCFAMTNEDKCRVDHFDSHIIDGMNLVHKSLKTNKPIVCVYCEPSDIILYFVEDPKVLQKRFLEALDKAKKECEESSEEEIEELEAKLADLKKKKKK